LTGFPFPEIPYAGYEREPEWCVDSRMRNVGQLDPLNRTAPFETIYGASTKRNGVVRVCPATT